MCGIALILSGVHIEGCDLHREHKVQESPPSTAQEAHEPVLRLDDLYAALLRRGPDNIGSRKIMLQSKGPNLFERGDEEADKEEDFCLQIKDNSRDYIISSVENGRTHDACVSRQSSNAEIELLGATLQLRGLSHVTQPLQDLVGNLLVYNGEIFEGIHVAGDQNDGQALLGELEKCCCCGCHGLDALESDCWCTADGQKSVPEVLSTIRGPWALVYWQEKSKIIWFGRDAFGRRSLLVHWPTFDDSRIVLSSVSAFSSVRKDNDPEAADVAHGHTYWEELPCGIYSIQLNESGGNELCMKEKIIGQFMKHSWTDSLLNRLTKWERTDVEPTAEEFSLCSLSLQKTELQSETNGSLMNNCRLSDCIKPARKVLVALKESVMRRTAIDSILETRPDQNNELVPIALLFSGGLDSMILAALLDQCLDSRYPIDLLNVSFDGQLAPDRISARIGVKELQDIAPSRRWRLVEIDATLSSLTWETKHLMSLIHPAKTYMDLNIGIALWLAAGGDGWVDGEVCNHLQDDHCRYKYKSAARVLLVGSGADEQCAGYGRHKTKYRQGGWSALQEEMRLDMQRIWKRNLGRDDRCISDHGKEARFPFLDEHVIKTLLELPLWEIAELDEPAGRGDKKILREVAHLLGIKGAALLPKRAIQFGSRIARESNRKTFGSNRAANQASAGSVEISET